MSIISSATAEHSEKIDFLDEIELVKKIAKRHNPFVVGLVGCVTLQEPMCLLTEFVCYGNLEEFLQALRKRVSSETVYLNLSHVYGLVPV